MKLPGACDANLGALRQIEQGRTPGQVVETAVAAVMLGAQSVEDVERLREDPAVEKMLGYAPASQRSVRDWLEKCHDEEQVVRARQAAADLELKACVPEPTTGLRGLQTILGVSAREAAARLPGGVPRVATVDLDATVVESGKRAAFWAYTGVKGYQPVVAVWAEGRVILATEFRDGNVPAGMDPLTCARLAFAELPGTVEAYGFRGDSACDNQELLAWLDDGTREGGPAGVIRYAVSVRMVTDVVAAAKSVTETVWTTFGKDADGTLRNVLPPQHGHAVGAGWTRRSRGR